LIMITVKFSGIPDQCQAGVAIMCDYLGIRPPSAEGGIPICVEAIDKNIIIVEYDGASGRIVYCEPHHLYRAIGLFVEACRDGEPFRIEEIPQFDRVGAMMDCSRNAVLRVDAVKELLRSMALMGMNTLMLYTEDTYTVDGEPYFGYMRGKYRREEIRECDDYAASLGIELVPCIQTLAHMESFLRWESCAHLRDAHDVLLVGEDGVYDFIGKLVKAAAGQFRSKRIHIGMDEAHWLGRGRSRDLHGPREPFDLMAEHLSKVTEIVRAYGLEPMMWSDMFFRIGSKTHDYYDLNSVIPPSVAEQIPEDMGLVYWDYYHDDAAFYQRYIQKHKQLGTIPIFAGGVWTWLGMCTHYERTFRCSEPALMMCKQEGVREVFVTAWGDNGAENNLRTALPALQFYAEHAYAPAPGEAKFKRRLLFCTGIPLETYQLIEDVDRLPGILNDPLDFSNASKYLLWQDVLLGLFDKHVEGVPVFAHFDRIEGELRRHMTEWPLAQRILAYPAKLCAVLKSKADIGVRLKAAYDTGDREMLAHAANEEIPLLMERFEQLRRAHYDLWMDIYKPFGWEVLDLRYGGAIARLKTAADRLALYLNRETDRLEELEEERIFFDNRARTGAPTDYFTTYNRIASPNIMG